MDRTFGTHNGAGDGIDVGHDRRRYAAVAKGIIWSTPTSSMTRSEWLVSAPMSRNFIATTHHARDEKSDENEYRFHCLLEEGWRESSPVRRERGLADHRSAACRAGTANGALSSIWRCFASNAAISSGGTGGLR